jgi:hypothetical protein
MQGLARHAEPGFHLGTDKDPGEPAAQALGQKRISAVIAVVTDTLAQQAGAHSHTEGSHTEKMPERGARRTGKSR